MIDKPTIGEVERIIFDLNTQLYGKMDGMMPFSVATDGEDMFVEFFEVPLWTSVNDDCPEGTTLREHIVELANEFIQSIKDVVLTV